MRAAVVVVGDLGEIRMQYTHTLAINSVDVDAIGYEGAPLPKSLTCDPRITVHRLSEPRMRHRTRHSKILFGLLAIFDAVRASFRLAWALFRIPRPDLLLVQNPPSIPTLQVSWIAARLRGARLVIDWHNLGYTILALRLGRRHVAVRLARWIEMVGGRMADAHLCVSRGFARFLADRFGLKDSPARPVRVLYDRPRLHCADQASSGQIRQSTFVRLGIRHARTVQRRVPTSWTADEDFDRHRRGSRSWKDRSGDGKPARLAAIPQAGHSRHRRGQRRVEVERRFAGLPARRVQLRTRWLEPEDYPQIVGSADLGLCLHRSSSGVDIPMKVVDLFGAGVPVFALDYGASLAERLRHGVNGRLFSNARQLSDLLFEAFETFPAESAELDRLRKGARRSAHPTWEEGWSNEARPVLLPG